MPRNRMIKPDFWDDEKLSRISRDARLTFIGLWTFSDDYGVVKGNTSWLKGHIFPYENTSLEVLQKWLDELHGFILPFEFSGEQFYYICNFTKHQKIDKPSEHQRNPGPPAGIAEGLGEDSTSTQGAPGEDSTSTQGALGEDSTSTQGALGEGSARARPGLGDEVKLSKAKKKRSKEKEIREGSTSLPNPLPEKIMEGSWEAFVEMRNRIKHPLTERAVALIVTKLQELSPTGEHINAIVAQSARNDWRDVYPLNKPKREEYL